MDIPGFILQRRLPLLAVLCASAGPAFAATDSWPVSTELGGGNTLALTGNFAYDANDFSGSDRFADKDFMRRKEFGFTLKKPGVYDAMMYFDYQSHLWLDVYARVETKALFGRDLGKLRAGYIKTPVGMDALTSARAIPLQELSLPNQAFYAGRRTGLEWSQDKPLWFAQVGAYGGKDLQGDNPGTMQAARVVWNPVKDAEQVIHLGLAASVEDPRGWRDGRDVSHVRTARLRSRPEAGLTDVRLVDSGALPYTDHIVRSGVEAAWRDGPLYVQAEALQAHVQRSEGRQDFFGHGEYVQVAYALTGETRPYAGGVFGNLVPSRDGGAVELLARYSRLDLDDGAIHGGREHDTTLGANWYLTRHFKFQANYVWTDASRAGVHATPQVLELRAQVMF